MLELSLHLWTKHCLVKIWCWKPSAKIGVRIFPVDPSTCNQLITQLPTFLPPSISSFLLRFKGLVEFLVKRLQFGAYWEWVNSCLLPTHYFICANISFQSIHLLLSLFQQKVISPKFFKIYLCRTLCILISYKFYNFLFMLFLFCKFLLYVGFLPTLIFS